MSLAELYRGVFRSTNPQRNESHLHDFLRGVSVLGITQEIARIFGETENLLRRRGDTVAEFDLMIAATALHHDLILLTADRDFERVDRLQTIYL
jgi:predicted nucleic acid-binding protein